MEYLLQFAVAAVSTVCFGVTFQVPRRHMLACGVGGGVGWLCYVPVSYTHLTLPTT